VGFSFAASAAQAVSQTGGQTMANQTNTKNKKPTIFSLDGWAVAIALLLAGLVRLGLLKHVAW
jgi:hypothetical protein